MSASKWGDHYRVTLAAGQIEYVGDWQLLDFLGNGGFGFTFKAKHGVSGELGALKIIDQDYEWQRKYYSHFISEAKALQSVDSVNVVKIIEHGAAESFVWIAMEFIQGSTLEEHLLAVGSLNDQDFLTMAGELLSGLASVHKVGIGHHDLKPANIMRDEKHSRWVIVDFGLAMVQHPAGIQANQIQGTLAYAAPEVFEAFSIKGSDLFSLGTVFCEALIGYNPWVEISSTLQIDEPFERMRVAVQDHHLDLTRFPERYRDVLASMHHRNPTARPNVQSLLQWFRSAASSGNRQSFSDFYRHTLEPEQLLPLGISSGETNQLHWAEFTERLKDDLEDRGIPVLAVIECEYLAELTYSIAHSGSETIIRATISSNSAAAQSLGWQIATKNIHRHEHTKSITGLDSFHAVAESMTNSIRLVWGLKLGDFSVIYLPFVD
jgi:serine/threonine protein kinase